MNLTILAKDLIQKLREMMRKNFTGSPLVCDPNVRKSRLLFLKV